MIDPVELKALVDKAPLANHPHPRRPGMRLVGFVLPDDNDAALSGYIALVEKMRADARQVLALSDEVERLGQLLGGAETNCEDLLLERSANRKRATAAESEAQALRERMGEINKICGECQWTDGKGHLSYSIERIAALSTTPKEKEG